MIKTLNGWRAVFALIIVLFHVGVAGFEEMTCAGVCFFFMVSGFLLRLKYPFKELDGGSYSRFAWRHALKLYPLHWLALALLLVALALVGRLVIRPGVLALDVALLQSWSLHHSVYFSYNPFAWFLSTLLFCYLCYPLLARWFSPLKWRVKSIIVLALILIEAVALAGADFYVKTAIYVFPIARLIDFVLGMMLADGVGEIKKLPLLGKNKNGTDIELVSLALLSVVVLTLRSYPSLLHWSDAIVWWLPVAVIVVSCYIYDKREGFIGKILASRPLQWLGDISFEIFMLQCLAPFIYTYLVDPVLWHFGITEFANMVSNDLFGVDANLLYVFVLPIVILLAWVINRLFTRPITRLLNRRPA